MSKKAWIAVAAFVALFAIAYVGSPFWAMWQFRNAAVSADVDDSTLRSILQPFVKASNRK